MMFKDIPTHKNRRKLPICHLKMHGISFKELQDLEYADNLALLSHTFNHILETNLRLEEVELQWD